MPQPTPTLDQRDITISTGWGPAFMSGCSLCSQDSPWGASCTFTSLPGCTSETATVTLQVGSSYVHVGTLTADELYTSVSSALESICPTPTGNGFTSCSTAKATIGGVAFIDSSEVLETEGELVVSVESSSYELSQIREAMIQTIANAVKVSATQDNCYTATHSVLGFRARRDAGPWWLPSFLRRDAPHETPEQITLCNALNFAGPQYIPPQPMDESYIDTSFSFEVPPGGDFLCDLLEAAADDLAFVLPMFAVEEIEGSRPITWAYNWASHPYFPSTASWPPDSFSPSLTFVPTLVLSFNEPDGCCWSCGNSCMNVSSAVSAYRTYINPLPSTYPGLSLGAPAVTNGEGPGVGLDWLRQFMAACSTCTVDFIPLHFYGSVLEPGAFKTYVSSAWKMFGRPIWVTEFGTTSGTEEKVLAWLGEVLPWLDAQPYVERYAYFMDNDRGVPYLLTPAHALTSIGKLYST
ncbi:glycosyl hydrolase catalytic core-domain-containing protein [Astrocystis sublimbata]|nr:glycosyl hydrolase catalytic core-domain-containing protein [Astrocystis sublimbata]